MTDPLLSVVVPFYDVEEYLHDCLESIRRQTYSNLEVVLVDDGSPGRSPEIADAFAAGDSRFRVLHIDNSGPGPARNRGIAEATGAYLAFVDGDDLVPRDAYRTMMDALSRSGSSFVLGNAKRFSRTSGVRPSWTHAPLCTSTRLASHILEKPVFVRDRMLWNHIYRRDFWDDNGYEFPAIRYEDYPVALSAHLDALTADVLQTPVYYWRERESGDSITQQVFRYDNLLDRVVSAEMIFDILDRKASPEVRRAAHEYLAGIDLTAIAQAFAVVPDEDVDRTVGLGQRLVSRLDISMSARPRFDQIQWHALRDGDADLLRELARFRDEGGLVGNGSVRRLRTRPWRFAADFPGRGRSSASSRAYTFPATALRLRSSVTQVRWDGQDCLLEGTAEIAHLPMAEPSSLRINLVNGIVRIPLEVERFDTVDQHAGVSRVGFRTRVPLGELASAYELIWPLRFELDLTVTDVRRVGPLAGAREGSPTFPGGHWLTDREWVQPGRGAQNAYLLHRVPDPVVLSHVEPDSDGLLLQILHPDRLQRAALKIDRPSGPVLLPGEVEPDGDGTRVTIRMPAKTVLDGDLPDDPFTLRSLRAMRLESDLGPQNLAWPDHVEAASVEHGDELLSLVRTMFGLVNVVHGPANPSAVRASIEAGALTVTGREWTSLPIEAMSWRRFFPGSDSYVDVPCDIRRDEQGWSVTTPSARLIPEQDQPLQPGAPAGEWTLFVTLPTGDSAVACQAGLAAHLPLTWDQDGRSMVLTTIADTLRLQVR
ncbi:glycosyltransferase [Luteipulveratus sp. YIM 133132]|uniref:glycosyltransferase family 2 protein n=1 Tax=Luteipulveratus flavus TaxID=3031728 RepID=UPI0023AF9BE7|nr:glycosyltransferase [Luteipulveratus sp. YIM 133132]MDE9366978.1 glycosyltransferase [Luteipulveratus sp. YIM 133132]